MKPMGYSSFPQEIIPMPLAWVKADMGANLVWCKRHDRVCTPQPRIAEAGVTDVVLLMVQGGHFAAMEVPELLAEDIKEFVLVL